MLQPEVAGREFPYSSARLASSLSLTSAVCALHSASPTIYQLTTRSLSRSATSLASTDARTTWASRTTARSRRRLACSSWYALSRLFRLIGQEADYVPSLDAQLAHHRSLPIPPLSPLFFLHKPSLDAHHDHLTRDCSPPHRQERQRAGRVDLREGWECRR